MKLTRNLIALMAVAVTLMGGIARAQAPAADATTVTNANTTTTTEAVTTTSPDAAIGGASDANAAPLPNTGGEPLLMVLGGIVLAGGSLLLRRKLA